MSAPLISWLRHRRTLLKLLNPPNVGEATPVSDKHGSLLLLGPVEKRALFFRAAELGRHGDLKGSAGGVAQLDTTDRKLTERMSMNNHPCQ
jgi:hypothetical protein